MTPEQHEALTRIDADRKLWMACEMQVDCQISNAEATVLVEEFFHEVTHSEPIGWWYQDSTGCIHMSLDMELGRRHERETGHPLNLMYGKPVPSEHFVIAPAPQTHARVKPLEWHTYPGGGNRMAEGQNQQRNFVSRALLPWGGAFFTMEKDGVFTLEGSTEVFFDTEQAAKDAAQTQFDAWIRAALAATATEDGR